MKPLASATLNVDGEHDLADEVLTRIEERENAMRERLEKLNRQIELPANARFGPRGLQPRHSRPQRSECTTAG